MSENPYAPPKAHVELAEQDTPGIDRPKEVVWAIRLAVINYVLGLVVIAATWSYLSKLQPLAITIFSQLFSLAILFWLFYKIYQGRNWARIVWLVLTLFGLVMIPFTYRMIENAPAIMRLQTLIGAGVSLATIWLLFLTPGREWFRRGGR